MFISWIYLQTRKKNCKRKNEFVTKNDEKKQFRQNKTTINNAHFKWMDVLVCELLEELHETSTLDQLFSTGLYTQKNDVRSKHVLPIIHSTCSLFLALNCFPLVISFLLFGRKKCIFFSFCLCFCFLLVFRKINKNYFYGLSFASHLNHDSDLKHFFFQSFRKWPFNMNEYQIHYQFT